MRLIDADKLVQDFDNEQFTEWCNNMNVPLGDKFQLDGFHIGLAKGQVFLQPIAYDIDEVIEQLKSTSYMDDSDWYSDRVIHLDDAIEIVKKGGIKYD